MAEITKAQLEVAIKSNRINGAYYIYGADFYAVEQLKKMIVANVVQKGDEDFNLHEFESKGISLLEVCEVCDNIPMFAEKLCVTISDLDADAEKIPEADIKALIEEIQNLPDTTVLIFFNPNVDVCGGKKYPSGKNKKIIDAIAKNGTVVKIPIRTQSEAIKDITAMCKDEGLFINVSAARMLYERLNGDFMLISSEIAKLCSYTSGIKQNEINESIVELLTPDTPDAKSYELADAVASGNVSLSLKLLSELFAMRSDPIFLLYVITGSMIDLYRVRLAMDKGKTIADVMTDFGYPKNMEFKVKNAFNTARNIKTERLKRCIDILLDTDIKFKSGAGIPSILLEEAIIKMSGK